MWYVYIIKKTNKYYTGITTNLNNRLRKHENLSLLYTEEFADKYKAAQRERQIKAYSHRKKEQLIATSLG